MEVAELRNQLDALRKQLETSEGAKQLLTRRVQQLQGQQTSVLEAQVCADSALESDIGRPRGLRFLSLLAFLRNTTPHLTPNNGTRSFLPYRLSPASWRRRPRRCRTASTPRAPTAAPCRRSWLRHGRWSSPCGRAPTRCGRSVTCCGRSGTRCSVRTTSYRTSCRHRCALAFSWHDPMCTCRSLCVPLLPSTLPCHTRQWH